MSVNAELMWAAGFWDGEGCCAVKHSGRRHDRTGRLRKALCLRPNLMLDQVEREPLDRFVEAVGVGAVRGPYSRYGRVNWRPWWRWWCSAEEAERVIALLRPHVSAPKRAQFDRVLRECDSGQLELKVIA